MQSEIFYGGYTAYATGIDSFSVRTTAVESVRFISSISMGPQIPEWTGEAWNYTALLWKKEDFIGYQPGMWYELQDGDTLSATFLTLQGANRQQRFMVMQDDQIYLSAETFNTTASTQTLSIDTSSTLWYTWDPSGGDFVLDPSSQTPQTVAFTDIQALGYYAASTFDLASGTLNQRRYVMPVTEFQFDVTAIPEPTTGLMTAMGLLLVTLLRRPRRVV